MDPIVEAVFASFLIPLISSLPLFVLDGRKADLFMLISLTFSTATSVLVSILYVLAECHHGLLVLEFSLPSILGLGFSLAYFPGFIVWVGVSLVLWVLVLFLLFCGCVFYGIL